MQCIMVKNYKCGSCERAFSRAISLKIHIKAVHHGQKDHKCDSCGKESHLAEDLKKHINSVHNDKKITNVTHVKRHFLKQDT